jgi:predicted ribosomally synthesized peptide with SipW-like signal peptide
VNRKLMLGVLSGLAAIALAVGGSTYAAFSDFGQIDGNVVGVGFLKLSIGVGGGANAALDFGQLMPGAITNRLVWVGSDDGESVPDANLYLTLHNLTDHAALCETSRGKAIGEVESGISGCTVVGDAATGTPAQGNLSRVLSVGLGYYPAIRDATACAGVQSTELRNAILAATSGNLYASATANDGAGVRYRLTEADGTTALKIAPSTGACIGIDASWPPDGTRAEHPSPSGPSDNAAQGDSLTVDIRFDLVQAA